MISSLPHHFDLDSHHEHKYSSSRVGQTLDGVCGTGSRNRSRREGSTGHPMNPTSRGAPTQDETQRSLVERNFTETQVESHRRQRISDVAQFPTQIAHGTQTLSTSHHTRHDHVVLPETIRTEIRVDQGTIGSFALELKG